MQELVHTLLTTWPWQLRVAIGHVLPLFVAIWCLWSLRGYWRDKAAVAFVFALGAGYGMADMAFQAVSTPLADGRVQVAVQGTFAPLLWLVVMAAMTAIACGKRIPWQAAFAGIFFPLWAIDLKLGSQLFTTGEQLLGAIGGAGPVDALLLGPLFAVALTQVARLELAAWPWLQGAIGRLRT